MDLTAYFFSYRKATELLKQDIPKVTETIRGIMIPTRKIALGSIQHYYQAIKGI
jgi:hypothetical protein